MLLLPSREQGSRGHRGPKNALHFAASEGSTERTAALFDQGHLDVNQGDPDGWTPLMVASQRGYSRIVRLLLSKGADVLIVADFGFTALLTCAQYGNVAVSKILVGVGADLEAATSTNGSRPLHLAADKGHSEVMSVLIEAGADPDSRRFDRATPLYMACERGYVESARVLLRANANPLLIRINASRDTFVPLDAAAGHGRSQIVRELLRQLGIEGCGGPSGGVYALHHAAKEEFVDIMAILAHAGVVDTGISLVIAAKDGREASMKFLLQQQERLGKPADAYVNRARDPFGRTPLLCSIDVDTDRSCYPRIVRLLVDAGADTASAFRFMKLERVVVTNNPLGLTSHYLREKKAARRNITEGQLHRLEAVRRLLLRVEVVHAVSWLWPSDSARDAHVAEVARRTNMAPIRLTIMLPILRRRASRRDVLFPAVFRYSSKP